MLGHRRRSTPRTAGTAGIPLVSASAAGNKGRHDRSLPRLGQFSWALYDWANSAFSAVIITFVYATYFTKGIAADEITGTAKWGWAMAASGIAIALLSPVLGAIADAGGRRKPWLFAWTVLAVVGCWLLWSAGRRRRSRCWCWRSRR